MTTISATSILGSRHALSGDTLHTLLLRYPRWIHAEFMTHRKLSRNAASSRAIPVKKIIEDVVSDPAFPIIWTKNEPGMQGYEELEHREKTVCKLYWERAMNAAIKEACFHMDFGAHKQVINRLLEPFSHITVVASATNWSNFLYLRDHPHAEPHIQMLAREIKKAIEGAKLQDLRPGEWHLPFISSDEFASEKLEDLRKLSVARCASTSYKTVDGFDMTMERAVALHDKLVGSDPLHASPCEHVAKADDLDAWFSWMHREEHGNFVGFRQYRKMLPGECH